MNRLQLTEAQCVVDGQAVRDLGSEIRPHQHEITSGTLEEPSVCLARLQFMDNHMIIYLFENVNVNVTDTILWQGHHDRVMQLNLLHFCGIC